MWWHPWLNHEFCPCQRRLSVLHVQLHPMASDRFILSIHDSSYALSRGSNSMIVNHPLISVVILAWNTKAFVIRRTSIMIQLSRPVLLHWLHYASAKPGVAYKYVLQIKELRDLLEILILDYCSWGRLGYKIVYTFRGSQPCWTISADNCSLLSSKQGKQKNTNCFDSYSSQLVLQLP